MIEIERIVEVKLISGVVLVSKYTLDINDEELEVTLHIPRALRAEMLNDLDTKGIRLVMEKM